MANTYAKVSGTFEEIDNAYGKVSGTWQEADEIYAKVSGTWELVFAAFQAGTVQTLSSGSGTFTVPQGANAIHIQAAVGGGGGAVTGADYDKAGGESAGAGGSSGGYISDKVFSVTGGETLTINAGTGGAGTGGGYNTTAASGGNTTVTGTSSSTLFTLTGGAGSSASGGGVQGPLRSNAVGAVGTATISGTVLTSGTTVDGLNITSFTSGPVGTFNQSGDGNVGTNPGNCSGDNCQITGGTGGSSYAGPGAVTGGTGAPAGGSGTVGTRGAGGGGGGAQPQSAGTAGGAGEVSYRFMRIA